MEQNKRYRILWQKRADGGARLLRMYGESAWLQVPVNIAGYPLVEIAPYCFAQAKHFLQGEIRETVFLMTESGEVRFLNQEECDLPELCGSFVEKVILPHSICEIGNCAFYNCKNLRQIELGSKTEKIGSDAFMNTLSFHQIHLRCGAAEKSGIKQMLSQISSDMEVTFTGKTGIEAVLLYPEYFEAYDEIAPAHIFGRSIVGEGFRARQCFKEGVVDFAGYDNIFPQACVEESVPTLSSMALNRLQYPVSLSKESRINYQDYVTEHMTEITNMLIHQRKLPTLQFLCREKILYGVSLAESIRMASEADWTEGTASLLRMRAENQTESRQSRYEFDDF